jgi:hypothetical protein
MLQVNYFLHLQHVKKRTRTIFQLYVPLKHTEKMMLKLTDCIIFREHLLSSMKF